MELRHLRYFVAVAEELHFRRAAERLHISQPPLSQQIRQLEEELDVQLLERSRRRVELTAAGAAFYERAREILDAVDDAARLARQVQRGDVGRLSVGFVGSAMYSLVPDVLRAFRSRREAVDLRLRELTSAAQLDQLESGRIDVGFVRPTTPRSGIVTETVLREEIVVALPESSALAERDEIDLDALRGKPLVLLSRTTSPGVRATLEAATRQFGGEAQLVQEAAEIQTVIGLVAGGVGFSLVPGSVRSLARRGVAYRRLTDGPSIELALAWRVEDRSPVLGAFRDVVRELAPREGRDAGPRPEERERGRGPANRE
jgi:DNA-binding transcriptional LysR family regulator